MHSFRLWLTVLLLLLVGCAPGADAPASRVGDPDPISDSLQTKEQVSPVEQLAIPLASQVQTLPTLSLRVSTTSDWTTIVLMTDTAKTRVELYSSSGDASQATVTDGQIYLEQPLSQAETGNAVELVAVWYAEPGVLGEQLELEIDRGHIGETTVEVYGYACGDPTLVDTFVWAEILESGENVQRFTLSTAPIIPSSHNEYTVIAQLNFWYYGPGLYGGFENDLGERITPLTPLLGETYTASDPDVVYQQIEWAAEYGVDAFSIEWTTPRGIGCCGSMEDTLDDVFLKSPNIHKVRWAIFYDFVLRLDQTEGLKQYVGGLNFDQPAVYETFVADFVHFAKKYFDHPQYLTIDGRPVIYIWATNAYVGDLAGAMREAREKVAELGFDVFIVGDELRTDLFNPAHVSLFDASTTFTFLIPGIDWYSLDDVGEASIAVDKAFRWWTNQQAGLHVAGRDDLVNFQPAWAPQYDERNFIFDRPKYVPALSQDQVRAMAEVARTYAQPVGSKGEKLIWLNTWNNWAETATVEPTADLGPKYPAGNYQFDMLEVVREIFGRETYGCFSP